MSATIYNNTILLRDNSLIISAGFDADHNFTGQINFVNNPIIVDSLDYFFRVRDNGALNSGDYIFRENVCVEVGALPFVGGPGVDQGNPIFANVTGSSWDLETSLLGRNSLNPYHKNYLPFGKAPINGFYINLRFSDQIFLDTNFAAGTDLLCELFLNISGSYEQ